MSMPETNAVCADLLCAVHKVEFIVETVPVRDKKPDLFDVNDKFLGIKRVVAVAAHRIQFIGDVFKRTRYAENPVACKENIIRLFHNAAIPFRYRGVVKVGKTKYRFHLFF